MDIKAKIEELVQKIKSDDGLLKKFTTDPIKTLEDLMGVDLPDEQIRALAEGVKAKLEGADIIGKLEKTDIGGKLGELAGKAGAAIDDVADKLDLNEKAAKLGDAIGGLFGKK